MSAAAKQAILLDLIELEEEYTTCNAEDQFGHGKKKQTGKRGHQENV